MTLVERAENRLDVASRLGRALAARVSRRDRRRAAGARLEQAVRSTAQRALSSRRSFEAGARTRLDILNAEQQAGTAHRDLVKARFAYLIARSA